MLGRIGRALRRQSKRVAPGTGKEPTTGEGSTVKSRADDGVGIVKLKSRADTGVVRPRKLWRKSRRVVPFDAKKVVPASAPSAVVRDAAVVDASKGKNLPPSEPLPKGESSLASILRYSLRVSLACTNLLHLYPDQKPDLVGKAEDQEEEEREETKEEKRARAKASAARKLRDKERLPVINADFVQKSDETVPPQQDTPIDDKFPADPIPKRGPRLAWAEKNEVQMIEPRELPEIQQKVFDSQQKGSHQD